MDDNGWSTEGLAAAIVASEGALSTARSVLDSETVGEPVREAPDRIASADAVAAANTAARLAAGVYVVRAQSAKLVGAAYRDVERVERPGPYLLDF